MNRLKPSLPVFAIGAGAVHAIALAILLPLLITLPGPGSSPPKPVNIEVDLRKGAESAPVVPDLSAVMPASEETSALPPPSEPEAEAAGTLAAVNPEASPEARVEPDAAPAPAERRKPKAQVKAAKPAQTVVRRAPQKKTLFPRGLTAKPLFGGSPVRSRSQGQSWGALFNAPH